MKVFSISLAPTLFRKGRRGLKTLSLPLWERIAARSIWTALALFFIFQTADCSPLASAFAVLNLKKVASESESGKSIEKQIEAINQEAKKDLQDLESKIKSMESDKKSDYDARKTEDMQMILYDMVRSKKYQISEAYSRAVAVFDREMRKVVEKICREKGVKIVVNSEAVVYLSEECSDITQEVIKELDETCKSIKVELKELK